MNDWSAFPVGTRVRCADPDAFIADVARRLRNREGIVARHQAFYGAPIVEFAKAGNRKAYQWVPPSPRYVETVT